MFAGCNVWDIKIDLLKIDGIDARSPKTRETNLYVSHTGEKQHWQYTIIIDRNLFEDIV
jgi:hypothetical protein